MAWRFFNSTAHKSKQTVSRQSTRLLKVPRRLRHCYTSASDAAFAFNISTRRVDGGTMLFIVHRAKWRKKENARRRWKVRKRPCPIVLDPHWPFSRTFIHQRGAPPYNWTNIGWYLCKCYIRTLRTVTYKYKFCRFECREREYHEIKMLVETKSYSSQMLL